MLAREDQPPRPGVEPLRSAEVVVGVRPAPDPGDAVRAAHQIARQLTAQQPGRSAAVLLLSDGEASPQRGEPRVESAVTVLPWSHPGQRPLEAALRAAHQLDAQAVAVVSASPGGAPGETAIRLLAPLLSGEAELTLPLHATRRFEGVVGTGIAAPLLRALFGRRVREPLGDELAASRGLVDHLLGDAWSADPAHAGDHLWLVTAALAGGFRPAQANLGPRPPPPDGVDLPQALATTMGGLFHQMRLHAQAWQRVKGSKPVPTHGFPEPVSGEGAQPALGPLLSAFTLGYQELGRLWGELLPPQTLLALKRLTGVPEASFAIDDALWARIVYDFGVGYHLGTLDRAVLLRSMTPLYLAWVASFVREVRDLSQEGVEARVERLCHAFEAVKPYLIQRWRWPDRFNP